MSVTISTPAANQLGLKLTAYHNLDDVQLFWRTRVNGTMDQPIPGCLGFRIERQRESNGAWNPTEILRNFVGFTSQPATPTPGHVGTFSQPSSIWPFQTYEWTDHGASNGQTVRYRIIAQKLPNGGIAGTTPLADICDSGWTPAIDVTAEAGNGYSAYFNRGFVMSQFVARIARSNNWKATDIKEHMKELKEPLRIFLSGELRLALLRLLDEVLADPALSLYAALFELSDDELISKLVLLRGRAHIVLSNGSDKSGDENADARKTLDDANVDVYDRILGSKGLGHNKFAVVVRTTNQNPLKAWTGSTNWSPTGLCTQVNNGILIEDPIVAQLYLDQWQRLADAGSDFPQSLVTANAQSPRTSGNTNIWFTRVRNPQNNPVAPGADIAELINLVNSATQAILYVMFQPGPEPLASILSLAPNLYVRGVVSTLASTTEEKFTLKGIDVKSHDYQTALVQPEGIGTDFSAWIKEVTRGQFIPINHPGIGYAITHSKMIVIDPLSNDCKVITGSHNFSKAASESNDENFIVIRGNKALAEAYAVACLGTYFHYRWRAYVKEKHDAGQSIWDHLSDQSSWQQAYLTGELIKQLAFWC